MRAKRPRRFPPLFLSLSLSLSISLSLPRSLYKYTLDLCCLYSTHVGLVLWMCPSVWNPRAGRCHAACMCAMWHAPIYGFPEPRSRARKLGISQIAASSQNWILTLCVSNTFSECVFQGLMERFRGCFGKPFGSCLGSFLEVLSAVCKHGVSKA